MFFEWKWIKKYLKTQGNLHNIIFPVLGYANDHGNRVYNWNEFQDMPKVLENVKQWETKKQTINEEQYKTKQKTKQKNKKQMPILCP